MEEETDEEELEGRGRGRGEGLRVDLSMRCLDAVRGGLEEPPSVDLVGLPHLERQAVLQSRGKSQESRAEQNTGGKTMGEGREGIRE